MEMDMNKWLNYTKLRNIEGHIRLLRDEIRDENFRDLEVIADRLNEFADEIKILREENNITERGI